MDKLGNAIIDKMVKQDSELFRKKQNQGIRSMLTMAEKFYIEKAGYYSYGQSGVNEVSLIAGVRRALIRCGTFNEGLDIHGVKIGDTVITRVDVELNEEKILSIDELRIRLKK